MSYCDVLWKWVAWESQWKIIGLIKMNNTNCRRQKHQGQGAISDLFTLWYFVLSERSHRFCLYLRGEVECLMIQISTLFRAFLAWALYINWDFADGIFRHPLQFFKYLNQAKHKASGGRSISGMTAPKEK